MKKIQSLHDANLPILGIPLYVMALKGEKEFFSKDSKKQPVKGLFRISSSY